MLNGDELYMLKSNKIMLCYVMLCYVIVLDEFIHLSVKRPTCTNISFILVNNLIIRGTMDSVR